MKKEDLLKDEDITVTLTLDDDSELECQVVTVVTANDKDYIALLPLSGDEAETGNVFLYRYIETEGGEPVLENIVDDDEYEAASDAFDEYLDSAEFDELITEENN